MRDQASLLNPVTALAPAAVGDNTAAVGAIIDRSGFDSLTYVINLGSIADANCTFAVKVEEGNASNLSDAADAAAASLIGTVTLAGFQYDSDNKTRKLGYVGNKRYTRITITPSGNSSDALIGCVAVLGNPALAPTTNPPA